MPFPFKVWVAAATALAPVALTRAGRAPIAPVPIAVITTVPITIVAMAAIAVVSSIAVALTITATAAARVPPLFAVGSCCGRIGWRWSGGGFGRCGRRLVE